VLAEALTDALFFSRPQFVPDSLLEGSGFELPVPRCALIANSAALVAPPDSAVSGSSLNGRLTTAIGSGPATARLTRREDRSSSRLSCVRQVQQFPALGQVASIGDTSGPCDLYHPFISRKARPAPWRDTSRALAHNRWRRCCGRCRHQRAALGTYSGNLGDPTGDDGAKVSRRLRLGYSHSTGDQTRHRVWPRRRR